MFSLSVTPTSHNDKSFPHFLYLWFNSPHIQQIPIVSTTLHPPCLSSLAWIPTPHPEPATTTRPPLPGLFRSADSNTRSQDPGAASLCAQAPHHPAPVRGYPHSKSKAECLQSTCISPHPPRSRCQDWTK